MHPTNMHVKEMMKETRPGFSDLKTDAFLFIGRKISFGKRTESIFMIL